MIVHVYFHPLLFFLAEVCKCGVEGIERENNENKRIIGGVRVGKVFDLI